MVKRGMVRQLVCYRGAQLPLRHNSLQLRKRQSRARRGKHQSNKRRIRLVVPSPRLRQEPRPTRGRLPWGPASVEGIILPLCCCDRHYLFYVRVVDVQHEGDRVSSYPWAEQMEEMEVYEEDQSARSGDG
ncbi:hypothetical protein Q5P01_014251 [Channa striata]|uniref:Uncharacterized protein n=1 Tax=Channa striata TaxID=64152 RepID=A0AA88SMN7_CHASR|nr:hypothetical protein Q5P01_014251 [Channa striata]